MAWRSAIAVLIIFGAAPSMAWAGWMGFRNDTPNALIVQESLPSGPVARSGRPQKLFANETVRDTPPTTVKLRTFNIFDPAKPDKPLYTGALPCPTSSENVLYVIKPDGRGGITVEPIRVPLAGPSTKAEVKK